jgi:hypothetical protein
MTILEEGRLIRSEVAKLRPDKRRRYPEELRVRILDWVARATASGMLDADCAKVLGVKKWRFTMWRRTPPVRSESLALVPLETVALSTAPMAIVTPSGYRIEGLGIDEVVRLLRELA